MQVLSGVLDRPRLEKGKVLVWTAELDRLAEARLRQLEDWLSGDEKQRALRFRFDRDRKRFIVARGVLREILGTYLDTHPQKVDFSYGPQGKPCVQVPKGEAVPRFNLSHSFGCAIYALAFEEVGVDLEFVRPVPEMQALVDQYFSIAERDAFCSLPPALKLRAFFSCWTRKEAYVKACGSGLHMPLDQFDVSVDPTSPARLLRAGGVSGDCLPWILRSFDPSAGAVAALVCRRESEPCLYGSWPPMRQPSGHKPNPDFKGLMTEP
jgi:4'-phosphopantetheinyl transferase